MGQSVAGRRSGGSELVLAQWEGSVIQRDGVMISARGEAAPGREKGGDDTSWADTNLLGQKMNKIHVINSADTNGR
jgi:hypothetical protein